jgi:F-type H+-transporting ATPase subunit b
LASLHSVTDFAPLGAARLRPTIAARVPAVSVLTSTRAASNVPAESPEKKAQSILNAVPGNSLVSKTATLSAAAGLSIAAISNELYVMNEETVAAFCLLSVFTAVAKYGGPAYREWAEGQVQKHKDILNAARADHTSAVQQRIDNVSQMSGVVEVTKQLFAVSKVGSSRFGC